MTTKDLATTTTGTEIVAETNGKAPVSPVAPKKDEDMITEADLQKALEKDAKSQAYHKEYNGRPKVMARNKERQEFNKEERRVITSFKKGDITGVVCRTQIAALKVKFSIKS